MEIQNSYNYGDLPLGLVAMATESSLTYNEKMVKLHFYAPPIKMASV